MSTAATSRRNLAKTRRWQHTIVEYRREKGTLWYDMDRCEVMTQADGREAKPLQFQTDRNGYQFYKVQYKGKRVGIMAHRLIWWLVFGMIPKGCDIHHEDFCRDNNHPDNLTPIPFGVNRATHEDDEEPVPF